MEQMTLVTPTALEVKTFGKLDGAQEVQISAYGIAKNPGETLYLAVNDAIPLYLGVAHKWMYAASITLEDALEGESFARIKMAMESEDFKPEEVEAVLGPSLTFSHVPVDEATMKKAYENGLRPACKGTSGELFLDPQMIVVLCLRRLGLKPENILISDYDTFENSDLLYSASRGDEEKNIVAGTLR